VAHRRTNACAARSTLSRSLNRASRVPSPSGKLSDSAGESRRVRLSIARGETLVAGQTLRFDLFDVP